MNNYLKLFLIFALTLFLKGCAVITTPSTSIYYYLKSGLITKKINDKELLNFVDSIITNYNTGYLIIEKSKYFDSNYSKFSVDFAYREFKDYHKQGYHITDSYMFSKNYQKSIRYKHFGCIDILERYPVIGSKEWNNIYNIANIHTQIIGIKSDPEYNSGDLIFTFCQRNDSTWYLRCIEFEFIGL